MQPARIRLSGAAGEAVEVWHADLDVSAEELESLRQMLDAGERARAGRILIPRVARRFVAARALLRMLVGRALGIAPEAVVFRYGPHGKPALAGDLAASGVRFNLSHSESGALVGLAQAREVGVDIECFRAGIDIRQLVERYFAPKECAWVLAAPEESRPQRFYFCWTAKEAYLKARGDGLAFPLAGFEVLPGPRSGAPRLVVYGDAAETARWELHSVPLPAGWTGALAVARSQ